MSNPPFGSPLYNEEDDFSFPYQPTTTTTNDDPINFPITLIEDQNTLPSTSSLLPISEYQDLSIFLDDDHHTIDYTLLEKYDPNNIIQDTINWATPIEHQVGLEQVHHEMQYYCPTTTNTTTITTAATTAGVAAVSGVGEGSSSKKLDHNAKEKVRRMKLNEIFLTLRTLLPDSRRAKVLIYIIYVTLFLLLNYINI